MTLSTSHWAGGMLAPWCEAESLRARHHAGSAFARSICGAKHVPDTPFNGSLVVAHPRDRADFERFARLTTGPPARSTARALSELEPSLDGRFRDGAVLSRRRPCRAAPRAAGAARAHRGRRRHHQFRQRGRRRRSRRHRDRLPRPCRARHVAGSARRQGRDDHRRDRRDRTVAPGAAAPSALAALHHPARATTAS